MNEPDVIHQKRKPVCLWNRELGVLPQCLEFSGRWRFTGLGFANGNLHLLDEAGKTLWETRLDSGILDLKIQEGRKRLAVLTEAREFLCFTLEGDLLFRKKLDSLFTSLQIRSGRYYLGGWNAGIAILDAAGRNLKSPPIPGNVFMFRVIPKTGEIFVVHDALRVAVYDAKGSEIWSFNNPATINLTGDNTSDLSASYSGDNLALTCFEKGLYLYQIHDVALKSVDLEKALLAVSISRDGNFIFLSDALGGFHLLSKDACQVSTGTLNFPIKYGRLDQTGDRVLVCEKSGTLTCLEFTGGGRERSEFLELTEYSEISEKREIWKRPVNFFSEPFEGQIEISGDGNYMIHGAQKKFRGYDSLGNVIWEKAFLSQYENVFVSHHGQKVMLSNSQEIYVANPSGRKDFLLTFYASGLRDHAMDPNGEAVMALDRGGTLFLFDREGKQIWKRKINLPITSFRLDSSRNLSVFKGGDRALYLLDLQSLRNDRRVFDRAIHRIAISPKWIWVSDEEGNCYALDQKGEIQWAIKVKGKLIDWVILGDLAALVVPGGKLMVVDEHGETVGEGNLHHARSLISRFQNEFLEIAPGSEALMCYNLLTGDLLWKLPLAGIQTLAVSPTANRMAVVDRQFLHYYYLRSKPELLDERTAYLEF